MVVCVRACVCVCVCVCICVCVRIHLHDVFGYTLKVGHAKSYCTKGRMCEKGCLTLICVGAVGTTCFHFCLCQT